MPNFYGPEQIKKMIDPREQARAVRESIEKDILRQMAENKITDEDFEKLYESVKRQRGNETVH